MTREPAGLPPGEERAREEAEAWQRFHEILEAAPDAIVQVDTSGRILVMNRATEAMFGYTRDELPGQSIEVLVPAASDGVPYGHRGALGKDLKHPIGRGLTLGAVRKDGREFPAEIRLRPVDSSGEARLMAVIRDVTEQRRIEWEIRTLEMRFGRQLKDTQAELARRNREVGEAERLKSHFLENMSRGLRTPLNTIIGYSQLLLEETEGPVNEEQRRFLDHIQRDSQHLLKLINDILDLSKIESGLLELRPETFRVRAELRGILEIVQKMARSKSIELRLKGGEDFTLRADIRRFREILLNLLYNALRFTPAGGRVTISISAAEEPGYCCLAVQDTGIGMAPDQMEAIFGKFHQPGLTTTGAQEGTGLGLAITKHLIEMHGGNIWVDSRPGCGSRFSFTMPLDSGNGRG